MEKLFLTLPNCAMGVLLIPTAGPVGVVVASVELINGSPRNYPNITNILPPDWAVLFWAKICYNLRHEKI